MEVLLIPPVAPGAGEGTQRGPAAPTAPQLLFGCCTQPRNSLPTSQMHLLCTTPTKTTPKATPGPKSLGEHPRAPRARSVGWRREQHPELLGLAVDLPGLEGTG